MAVARPSPFSTCRSMLPTCHSPINSCCSLYKTYPIGTHVLCFPVYTESSLRPIPSRRTLTRPGLIPALISSAPSLRGQIPNSDGRQANPLTTYLTPLESALTKNGRVTRSESADPKSLDLKSFRIRTSGKKEGGGGKLLTRNLVSVRCLLPGAKGEIPPSAWQRFGLVQDLAPAFEHLAAARLGEILPVQTLPHQGLDHRLPADVQF